MSMTIQLGRGELANVPDGAGDNPDSCSIRLFIRSSIFATEMDNAMASECRADSGQMLLDHVNDGEVATTQ